MTDRGPVPFSAHDCGWLEEAPVRQPHDIATPRNRAKDLSIDLPRDSRLREIIMRVTHHVGLVSLIFAGTLLTGALGQTTPTKSRTDTQVLRAHLLTQDSDLRLLITSQAELDRRIQQSACLGDSTGGIEERGIEIHVECDTPLRKVLDLVPFRREITPARIRVFQKDRILQYRSDVDECGRHPELSRFYETIIGRGDIIAIGALK